MTTQPQHTPLSVYDPKTGHCPGLLDKNGHMIGEIYLPEVAAFIVRAVNSHEALIATVKTAYTYFNVIANTPDKEGYVVAPDSMTRVILRKMHEAIAQAEGVKI